MRLSFLVYSSWQAKPCVMRGPGWERFLGSGTEARGGLCSRCPLASPAERPRPEAPAQRLRWLPCLRAADPRT